MNQTSQLPNGFEALSPFVEFWAAPTAADRARCRDESDKSRRAAFYDAVKPLAPSALSYLDAKPISQWDPSEQCLMQLLLSFVHVALAEELQREEEPKHTRYRHYMRITRATADAT